MAFGYNTYDDTATVSTGVWHRFSDTTTYPTAAWFERWYQSGLERVKTLVERAAEARARHRSRLPLPVWPADAGPTRSVAAAGCFAPRRVVVPRGTVSWIRAGTRRPL